MNLAQALTYARSRLSGIDAPSGDAEEILEFLTGLSRRMLYLNTHQELSTGQQARLDSILLRLEHDEPLAYILGRAYFHSRYFTVTPDVLIPRPDTEVLVETVLTRETGATCRFLDLGTGSGIIAAILAEQHRDWTCFAVDRSIRALAVARINCPPAVRLVCADALSWVNFHAHFDFLVSNPPYISDAALATLDRSVRDREPLIALRGGEAGTDFYSVIARQAPMYLKAAGRVYCEIGYDQKTAVTEIFSRSGWTDIEVIADLACRPRVIRAVAPRS